MVRALTLVLFVPTPIDTQAHREGNDPSPAGQLIVTVPVVVSGEPEITSTLANATLVAVMLHCACAGETASGLRQTTREQMSQPDIDRLVRNAIRNMRRPRVK